MEPILLQTSEEDRGARLDAFLARAMEDLTRSAAAKAIEEGRVLVSGKVPSKSLKLTGNETIEFTRFLIFRIISEARPALLIVWERATLRNLSSARKTV